jgi:predicted ATP-dependent serine protease
MIPAPQAAADAQRETPLFVCGECGEPVIVWNGRFFRTCEHYDSAINATPAAAKVVNGVS